MASNRTMSSSSKWVTHRKTREALCTVFVLVYCTVEMFMFNEQWVLGAFYW
jgi:hypothetical protein